MRVCRKCGAPLRKTDHYCSQCGAKVPVSPEEKRAERLEKQQKKELKKVHFRTAPPGRRRDRALDSFEEYENRSKALKTTVRALIIIIVLTAAAVLGFAWREQKWMFHPGTEKSRQIVLQSEESEAGKVESELRKQLNQPDS